MVRTGLTHQFDLVSRIDMSLERHQVIVKLNYYQFPLLYLCMAYSGPSPGGGGVGGFGLVYM